MQNIMNEYIKLTQEHIKGYMELIFKSTFDISIYNKFWKSYLNARYYDLNGDKSENTLKNEILSELEIIKRKLIENEKISLRRIIENMHTFFTQILYLDKVIPNKDLEKTIDTIIELRKELLELEEKDFRQTLKNKLEENKMQIDELLYKYDTKEFYLKISNYKTKNAYKVTLNYNFKIPMIYSNIAIDKAFSTGTVNEDKLTIEYSLISIQVVSDIIKGNFHKQYIIEFADSLFEKKQKLERALGQIENQVLQDKLNLKITYEVFSKNKELIYSLIKRGFRFAVIIDNTFENSIETITKLGIFKYILINKNTKWYHQIVDAITPKNIIEI